MLISRGRGTSRDYYERDCKNLILQFMHRGCQRHVHYALESFGLKVHPRSIERALTRQEKMTVTAIRRGHRVGIFDGETLILCVTKRHYRATWMVQWLYDHQKYPRELSLKIHTPHMKQQERYYPAIDQAEFVMKSEALRLKRTFSDRLEEWSEKK